MKSGKKKNGKNEPVTATLFNLIFPILLLAVASVSTVAVVAGLLVYYKKHKRSLVSV